MLPLANFVGNLPTYHVVNGSASPTDLNKIFLHICAFHIRRINWKHALKDFGSGEDEKSHGHFAMCLFGR